MNKEDEKNIGRIIQGIGGFYTVVDGDQRHVCRARGNFRDKKITPMVGDYVEYNPSTDESCGYITSIIDRKNHLLRPMVANIDMLVIVISPESPKPDFGLVDILLINAEKIDADVCLVINKEDLSKEYTEEILNQYRHIEKRFAVSAKTKKGISKFEKAIEGKTICFAGQSAVGKSSILNRLLPNVELQTGEVSEKTQRGKHTTRQADLLEYKNGYVVDSPGFSMLELELEDPVNIKDYYPDFLEYATGCKFNGCLHYTEPGCAVIEAVEKGEIDKDRHERYKKIYEQMNERWRKRYG
ncbi:MAG: ribosome small subunit-dependent GTPase A [Eubacteriales bacterium]